MALKEIVKTFVINLVKQGGFSKVLFENIEIVKVEKGYVEGLLKITREHTNINGNLHGGMTASLIDGISSLTILTYPNSNLKNAGVSVSLNVSYLSSASIDDEIVIKAGADKVGRKLAFLNCEVFNKTNKNSLIAKGNHVKFVENSFN